MEDSIKSLGEDTSLSFNPFDELDIINVESEKETEKKKELYKPKENYKPNESYCNEINQNDLKRIIDSHYVRRTNALHSLNNLMKYDSTDQYYYPNLDFTSNFGQYFYVDDPCLCKINIGESSEFIKIIQEFGRGKAGIATKININDKDYIVKGISNVTKTDFIPLKVKKLDKIYRSHIKENPCIEYNKHNFTHNNKTIFQGLLIAEANNFANQTCIHMILNEIFRNNVNNINNFVYQYDAFYCQNNGYNIMEIAEYGDLSNYLEQHDNLINEDLIREILVQIFNPLIFLKSKKYGFVHADLKCRNIFVGADPEKKPIFKLADFDKSSIFWKGIRFHTINMITFLSEPLLNYKGYNIYEYKESGEKYYLLSRTIQSNLPVQTFVMFNWLPMHMSYDFYTFIYSLIREPQIFKKIDELKNLKTILKIIFFEDDYVKIMEDLKKKISLHDNLTDIKLLKENLVKLRSLGEMNADLIKLDIKLKTNLDKVFEFLGLKSPSLIDIEIDNYHNKNQKINKEKVIQLSSSALGNRHICTTKCINNECNTNKYSNMTFYGNQIYDFDSCTSKK